jgi:hypothetical protein
MTEKSALAERVEDEINEMFEEFGEEVDTRVVEDFDSARSSNRRFVSVETKSGIIATIIGKIVAKDIVFKVSTENNKIVIECSINKSRYV